MRKAMLLVLVSCLFLGGCAPSVARTSSATSSSDVASVMPKQPEKQWIEVLGKYDVEILYEEWPSDIGFDGEPFMWSSHIYEKDGTLYYLSLKNRYYSINQKDLSTGEEETLYTTNKEVVQEFIVLDSGKILIWVQALDLGMAGGIPPRRTGRLYIYDMQTGEYENANKKFGLQEEGVFSFCANSSGIYIDARSSDYETDTTLYFIDTEDVAYTVWDGGELGYTANGNVYFTEQSPRSGEGVIYVVNPTMEKPFPIFARDDYYPRLGGSFYSGLFFDDNQAIFYAQGDSESIGEISTFNLETKQQEPAITTEAWRDYGTAIYPVRKGFECLYTTNSPEPGPDSIWDSAQLQCFDLQGNPTIAFPPFQLEQNVYFMWYCVVGDSVYYLVETTGLDDDGSYMQVSLSLAQLQAL